MQPWLAGLIGGIIWVSQWRSLPERPALCCAGLVTIRPAQSTRERTNQRLAGEFAARLLDEGIYVIGFSYPVVPKGQARIRVQLSAGHSDDDVDLSAEGLTIRSRQGGRRSARRQVRPAPPGARCDAAAALRS